MNPGKFLLLVLLPLFVILPGYLPNKPVMNRAALGKKLFEEKILSLDSSVSCASCHKPEFAFADTSAFSLGIKGQRTKRNTPSVLNMLNRLSFFWDGRAKTLEQQALMPIANKEEMGLPIPEAVKRLNQHPEYKKLFRQVFKQAP
ncbi:MAG: cytochrome-c peroxidase, partial [Dinghuibacter sp.]|nr:cytochrome-c peroxidase [Dinghuibacter sp.]